MGLEYIELTMACEEEFGIKIPQEVFADSEWETVGGAYCCIMRLIQERPVSPCPNVPVFFTLRKAFVETLNIKRSRITPGADLSKLIPLGKRSKKWRTLKNALPFWVPGLRTPVPMVLLGWMSVITSLPIALYLSWLLLPVPSSATDLIRLGAASAALIIALTFILYLFSATALSFSLPTETIGSLSKIIVAKTYGRSNPGDNSRVNASVWQRYQNLIAEQLGIDISLVTPETSFRELGFD